MESIKEKTADEMFEELGFEKYESREEIFYFKYNGAKEKYGIEFWLPFKEIYPVCKEMNEHTAIEITMQELQAINKKCKELGWLKGE